MTMAGRLAKMPQEQRDLVAFLKAHWPRFDPKRPAVLGIDSFEAVSRALGAAVTEGNWDAADGAMALMPQYAAFLSNRRYAGHERHLANLASAVAKRKTDKALLHHRRLAAVVHRVAADRHFADGERVSVIRTEHGWFDGSLSGTVKPGSGGYVVLGDDGYEHEIEHLRDIR